MKIGLIGNGAIAGFVRKTLDAQDHKITAILVRPNRVTEDPSLYVSTVQDLPSDIDILIDCAGHAGLIAHGADALSDGIDLITLSLGALADAALWDRLERAAQSSCARLHLSSGAIGALDCLSAARIGQLDQVTYIGRKPPLGWRGSPAEEMLDLAALTSGAHTHFDGNARNAALAYPKNANVAAAVAIAGLGFDQTQVKLIADSDVTANIHEVSASGDFGSFTFQIQGRTLPDNPRSSALAAMSVLSKLTQLNAKITL